MSKKLVVAILVIVVIVLLFYFQSEDSQPAQEFDRGRISKVKALCLSSAGTYIYSQLGALTALEELGLDLRKISVFGGSSAGAIISGLLACRISLQKISEFVKSVDLNELFKDSWTISSEVVSNIIGEFLGRSVGNTDITFGEVRRRFETELVVISTVVESGLRLSPRVFDSNSDPDVPIREAMTASSIVWPVITPASVRGEKMIDGAFKSHFPIRYMQNYAKLDEIVGVNVGFCSGDKSDLDILNKIDKSIRKFLLYDKEEFQATTEEMQSTITICRKKKMGNSIINSDSENFMQNFDDAYNCVISYFS